MAALTPPTSSRDDWAAQIAVLHAAELAFDEAAALAALSALSALATSAPPAWRLPFEADGFCQSELLCACPAFFWRRCTKRLPAAADAIAELSAALADADFFDTAPPDVVSFEAAGVSLTLQEGSYATGGTGRFVYAAGTALATLIAAGHRRRRPQLPWPTLATATADAVAVASGGGDRAADAAAAGIPSVSGLRVLDLGCGVGIVGLAAACCGAASVR